MKIKKSSKKFWLISISIFVFFSGVATYYILDKLNIHLISTDTKKPLVSKADTVKDTAPEPVKPDTRIKLPGASPVERIPGNYTDDDSLWRMVNKSHPFNDKHYRPSELSIIEASRTDKGSDERSVRTDIVPAVDELFVAAKKAGFDLIIGSGFRGYEMQNFYYTNYVKAYGQEAADTFSGKPGYSEHQTGLTMDLSTADRHCYIDECFGDTEAGKWLAENAHHYGFILRYPKGKDGITDFIYEPWHFRFVGKDLAKALFESGLSLDEAWPYLTANQP